MYQMTLEETTTLDGNITTSHMEEAGEMVITHNGIKYTISSNFMGLQIKSNNRKGMAIFPSGMNRVVVQ